MDDAGFHDPGKSSTKEAPLFGDYLQPLIRRGSPLELRRGAPLCSAGRDAPFAFAITAGRVVIEARLSRGAAPVGLAYPGDLVGALDVLAERPCSHDARVLSDRAKVVLIAGADLRAAVLVGDVGAHIGDIVWPSYAPLYAKIDVLSAGGVDARLAALLLQLARHGTPQPDGSVEVNVPLSRQELSSFVATSFETTIRVMVSWQRSGIVTTTKTGFVIRKLDRLREIAGISEAEPMTRRVQALTPGPRARLHLSLEPGDIVWTRNDRLGLVTPSSRVYFDAEGRLHRAWLGGKAYERTQTGRLRRSVVTRSKGRRTRRVQLLESTAAAAVVTRCHDLARTFLEQLPKRAPERLQTRLTQVTKWTRDEYAKHDQELSRVYRSLPVLPPDQAGALMLQPSEGCAWNRCSFCTFYRDEPFRMKSPEKFREHVRDVARLIGKPLQTHRRVFLGQASAFQGRLDRGEATLRIAAEELGTSHPWRFGGFVNPALVEGADSTGLSRLGRAGLDSVTLGLESGAPDVLARLNKAGTVDAYVDFARSAGEAGLRRGVVVLLGAAGVAGSRDHVAASVCALERMKLSDGDRVYLSPLVLGDDAPFAGELAALGAPSVNDLRAEATAMRDALRRARVPATIAPYDVARGAA